MAHSVGMLAVGTLFKPIKLCIWRILCYMLAFMRVSAGNALRLLYIYEPVLAQRKTYSSAGRIIYSLLIHSRMHSLTSYSDRFVYDCYEIQFMDANQDKGKNSKITLEKTQN